MQSLTYCRDNSFISVGDRRGKSDLARFSLDLSWARAVSDSARLRAYPSPPMSGSPPLPPRRNPDASDRGQGSYGSLGREIFGGAQMSQIEFAEQTRGPPLRSYQEALPPTPYSSYRVEDISQQSQYQQHRPQSQISQQQLPTYTQQPLPPFSTTDRPSIGETPDYLPKGQRKAKGHVASACVPCKRAHLRCDAQRPCSRCLSNGKEDACVDVQHKKRGRPRLRDERESRYEALGSNFQPPPTDPSMRRPPPLYNSSDNPLSAALGESISRSGSYRVLKSQVVPHIGPGVNPRYLEHASLADANVYGPAMTPTPRPLGHQEPICAYLTMDMQIAKATQAFGEAIGLMSVAPRKLHDIVSANDRDKVFRLQRLFEDERNEREPNYLPPIYPKFEENRVIQSVGFGPEEMDQIRLDRQEMLTFQGPDGQQRTFQLRLGLAKKDSTYFVILLLNLPARPPTFNQPTSSPYSREMYSRDLHYGYQTGQQPLAQPEASPFIPDPTFGDSRGELYRTPPPLGSNIPPSATMPPLSQTQIYSQAQIPYQTPRSKLPQVQLQAPNQRQLELQLPPLRDQRGDGSGMRLTDIQTGRLDIGGLLEEPGAGRGGS